MQNRLRSKVLWASMLSLGLFVAKTYFNIDIPEGDKLADLILVVVSAAGIINNPTNGEGL